MKDFDLEIRIANSIYLIIVHVEESKHVIAVSDICEWIQGQANSDTSVEDFVRAPHITQKKLVKKFLEVVANEIESGKTMSFPLGSKEIFHESTECYDTGLANHMNMLGWVKSIPKSEIDQLIKIGTN